MKTNISWLLVILMATVMLAPPGSKAAASAAYEGIIDLYDSDDEGNPIQVGMYAEEKDISGDVITRYFIIKDTPKGKELLSKVGENVKVIGRIEVDENGQSLLAVEEYSLAGN